MMRYFLTLLLLTASAQSADIISSARLADWSDVGVDGGIPDTSGRTIYANHSTAVTRATVQTSLNNCPANQVVQLGDWTNTWTGALDWQGVNDGVVLRGTTNSSGFPTTLVKFSSGRISMRGFYTAPPGGTISLTADFSKGSTTITVGSASAIVVGALYMVTETDDSAKILESTDEGTDEWPAGTGGRGMGHIVKVVSKTATTITTELPSPYTYRTSQSARIEYANYNPTVNSPLTGCGIEDLKIEQTYAGGDHMVNVENADNCWVRNCNLYNVSDQIHIMVYGSYRCEFRHNVIGESHAFGGGKGYGIALYQGGAGHLVIDNELYDLHVALQANYSVAQSVFAYNYIHGGTADSSQDPGMNQHGIVASEILWEGNWSEPKFMADDTHGSGGYMSTVFRNRITGHPNSYTYDRSTINLRRYCRSFNIVGNILGDDGYHTIYKRQATVDTYSDSTEKVIFVYGYGATGNDNATAMDVQQHVNYEVVNDDIIDDGTYTTSDLVDSYFLSSTPAFFGALPWPPFSPANGAALVANSNSYTNIPAGWRAYYGTEVPIDAGTTANRVISGTIIIQGTVK